MRIGFVRLVLLTGILNFLAFQSARCQTSATTEPEGTFQLSLGASFSSTRGPLDNGSIETVEKRVWKYGSARFDAFTFGGGFLATTGRFQAEASLAHLLKPNQYLNSKPILPFVNLGGGAVKNSNGITRGAWAVGAGVDYRVNGTLRIRVIDFTLLGSKIIPGGTIVLSNFKSVATGLTLTFPSAPTQVTGLPGATASQVQ